MKSNIKLTLLIIVALIIAYLIDMPLLELIFGGLAMEMFKGW